MIEARDAECQWREKWRLRSVPKRIQAYATGGKSESYVEICGNMWKDGEHGKR